jgi:hypothetical protein
MSRAIPILPLWAFGACYTAKFTFTSHQACLPKFPTYFMFPPCVLHSSSLHSSLYYYFRVWWEKIIIYVLNVQFLSTFWGPDILLGWKPWLKVTALRQITFCIFGITGHGFGERHWLQLQSRNYPPVYSETEVTYLRNVGIYQMLRHHKPEGYNSVIHRLEDRKSHAYNPEHERGCSTCLPSKFIYPFPLPRLL